MSFSRPNVSRNFQKLQSFLLWFQMAYAVWQFVRTAKFFRLPYVMVASVWHGFDSWLKNRKIIMIDDGSEVDKDPSESDVLAMQSMPPGMTIDAIPDSPNVQLSFDPADSYIYLTTRIRAAHMKLIRATYLSYKNKKSPPLQFGKDDDLLWPRAHLIRRLSFHSAMDDVLNGNGYRTEPSIMCFFDYTTKESVNQNFVRFASIWPLILQARNYDFWSVILSIVIILMDLFSYFANKIWRFTQYCVSRWVKWVILQVSARETRGFCYNFMTTISTRFQCRNFVTGEASLKEVKELLLATHFRLDKEMIASLGPIICSVGVPRKDGPGTSQSIPFSMGGVQYSGLAQPPLTDAGGSSVYFKKPEDIKVESWSIADMAYFLQVCDHCNRLKFSPLKGLDGNNGVCSSFGEIVHGVKDRKFVLCQFKTSRRLFIT